MHLSRSVFSAASLAVLLCAGVFLASTAHAQWSADTTLGRLRIDRELLLRLPLRTLTDVNALLPGAIVHERQSYGYAGQPWEQATTLDGISLHDPFSGAAAVQLIPEGLSALTIHRTSYEAGRVPGAPSELALDMRRGGDELAFAVHASTDGFDRPGTTFLGATSQGNRQVVATADGPLLSNLRFSAAAVLSGTENRQPLYLFSFGAYGLTTDNFGNTPPNVPLPGPVVFDENFLPQNGLKAAGAQGRIDWDLSPVALALTVAFNRIDAPLDNGWPSALQNVFRRRRALVLEQRSEFVSLTGRMSPDEATTIDASAAYIGSRQRTSDPDFGESWELFVDSAANAQHGYDGFRTMYGTPFNYSTILQFNFAHEDAPNNRYARSEATGWQFDVRARRTISPNLTIGAGVHHESWLGRAYSISNISGLMTQLYGPDGRTPRTFASESERRAFLGWTGQMFFAGYDVDGRPVDDGPDAPVEPSTTSGFVEAAFTGRSSAGSVGLQAVSFRSGIPFAPNRTTLYLPRGNVRIEFGQGFSWTTSAGSFASLPPLWDYLTGPNAMTGWRWFQTPDYIIPVWQEPQVEFTPARSWMVESAGAFDAEWLSLRVGGFYRDESDRTKLGLAYASNGVPFSSMMIQREDVTLFGFQGMAELRPLSLMTLRAWYAWHAVDDPKTIVTNVTTLAPHPAARTHHLRGILTFHSAGTDRFGDEGVYAVAIYSGTSGFPYRRILNPASVGQSTAWNIGVRTITDPQMRVPASAEDDRMPFAHRIDLQVGGTFSVGGVLMDATISVYNLFDRKEVLGVYPTTGRSDDDGWLSSPYAVSYNAIPLYTAFYATINLANRWAYMSATGNDMYGEPRQVQVGLRVFL